MLYGFPEGTITRLQIIHKLPGSLPVVAHERRPGSPQSHSDFLLSQTHRHWTRGSSSPVTLSPDRLGAWTPEAAKKIITVTLIKTCCLFNIYIEMRRLITTAERSTYLDILGRERSRRGWSTACEGFSQSFTPPGGGIAAFLWGSSDTKFKTSDFFSSCLTFPLRVSSLVVTRTSAEVLPQSSA